MDTSMITDFFARLGDMLTQAFNVVSGLFLDYFMLIVAAGCWIRFISQLFGRGNFSALLLLWAVLATFGAIAMGQIFW